jgi:hypothetical protein
VNYLIQRPRLRTHLWGLLLNYYSTGELVSLVYSAAVQSHCMEQFKKNILLEGIKLLRQGAVSADQYRRVLLKFFVEPIVCEPPT